MKISVVIPVYNVAPYLKACLDSVVVAALNNNVEIICVDDGSNDGSGEMLDQYAQRVPQITVLHQSNAGVGAARNMGVRHSRGEWIGFVDADDMVAPNLFVWLENQIQRNHDVDMFGYEALHFVAAEEVKWTVSDAVREVDLRSYLPMDMINRDLWSCFYRRELLPDHLFRPYTRGEDRLFVGEVLTRVRSALVTDQALYAYRGRCGSAMNSRVSARKLVDRIGYSLEWLQTLTDSSKCVPHVFYHLVAVNLTESFVYDLHQLPEEESRALWRDWYALLPRLVAFPISPWSRFVVHACSTIRNRVLARILCEIPHRLKLMGLHR